MLFGVLERLVDGNLEYTASALDEFHLGIGLLFGYEIARLTGAWLVTSHSAVFDLDLHNAPASLGMAALCCKDGAMVKIRQVSNTWSDGLLS